MTKHKPWEDEDAPQTADEGKSDEGNGDNAPDLNSAGKPKTGALTGSEANVDKDADVDGSAKAQAARIKKAGVPIGGEQAPLALANLVSQGMSLKDARKQLGL